MRGLLKYLSHRYRHEQEQLDEGVQPSTQWVMENPFSWGAVETNAGANPNRRKIKTSAISWMYGNKGV